MKRAIGKIIIALSKLHSVPELYGEPQLGYAIIFFLIGIIITLISTLSLDINVSVIEFLLITDVTYILLMRLLPVLWVVLARIGTIAVVPIFKYLNESVEEAKAPPRKRKPKRFSNLEQIDSYILEDDFEDSEAIQDEANT